MTENDNSTKRYDWNLQDNRQHTMTEELELPAPTQRMPAIPEVPRPVPEQALTYHYAPAQPGNTGAPPQLPPQPVHPAHALPLPPRDTAWMHAPYGPSGGARFGSVVIALLGAGIIVGLWWIDAIASFNGTMNPLVAAFEDLGQGIEYLLMAVLLLGWVLIALALMLSGLGAGMWGCLFVLGAAGYIALILLTEERLPAVSEPESLIWYTALNTGVFGAQLIVLGAAAHFIRRAGYKKAVRRASR